MKRSTALLALLLLPVLPQQAQSQAVRQSQARPAPAAQFERRLTTVNQQTIARAIDEAAAYLRSNPGARAVVRLPAGSFDVGAGGGEDGAAMDLSRIDACPGGLTITGAGTLRTTLIKDSDTTGIRGRDASCITISHMTLMQRRIEVTQGVVVSANSREIVIDVPRGFPTPADLMSVPALRNSEGQPRYWLKRYVMAGSTPQLIGNERDVRWDRAERVPGTANRWRLQIGAWRGTAVYRPGELVGVKTKSGGQAYRFTGGRNITFDSVRWINDARGKFRDVQNVTIRNSSIVRPPPINGVQFAMSTSGGGPQIGHNPGPLTTGHLVENNVFEATGDDAISFSNAEGVIRNNRIVDVRRGVLLNGSPNVRLENNTLVRASTVGKRAGERRGRRNRGAANDNF
jgi:hypothetical protein